MCKAARTRAATPAPANCSNGKLIAGLGAGVVMLAVLLNLGCAGISSAAKSSSGNPPSPTNPYPSPGPGASGQFFGMATNVIADSWPGTMVPVTSWRSLGGSVKWADINTAPGTYNFKRLDQWLKMAQASHTDVMFTVYATPTWASSRGANSVSPNTSCVDEGQNGPGICDPPVDLACDGTGTDVYFQTFVHAVIGHVGAGKIKYWELWNEPNIPSEWNGDADCPGVLNGGDRMLARMARDMRAIVSAADPDARFTTPAPVGNPAHWIANYLPIGGAYADIVAFHGYTYTGSCPSDCPVAERIGELVDNLTAAIAGLPTSPVDFQTYPLFDTEGSWGASGGQDNITDPDQQAAFVARYYLLQMSRPVAKLYWYGWDFDNSSGALYDSSTKSLTAAGIAYQQIVGWTSAGKAVVGPCAQTSTQWTCTITSPLGAEAEAIWDTSQTCGSGACSTAKVSVASKFTAYVDMAGNATPIASQGVPVGLKPILLFAQ
jgi:hypothetical protein